MRSLKFQRFVVIFVGILLALDAVFLLPTGDEPTIAAFFALLLLYIFYLVVFLRRRKEEKEKHPEAKKSPLSR